MVAGSIVYGCRLHYIWLHISLLMVAGRDSVACRINGRSASLITPLRNGNIVHMVTSGGLPQAAALGSRGCNPTERQHGICCRRSHQIKLQPPVHTPRSRTYHPLP